MAKAIKLPSGRWKCQAYLGKDATGKRIVKSFTADTKKEAEFLASECVHSGLNDKDVKVERALNEYIEFHTKTHSPTTIKTYRNMAVTAYNDILDIPIKKLDNYNLSRWVNRYSADRNPKSVKNAYSLLKVACKMQGVHIPEVHLPQLKQIEYNIPTDDEVKKLIDYFRERGDQEMVISVMLGAYGMMRRGEICALTLEDIKDNTVHISKSLSLNPERKWELKAPKNVTSDRYVIVPQFIIDELPKANPIISCTPDAIDHRFSKACKKLGMNYHFHLLRHYGCSCLASHGIPDTLLQKMGGWSSDKILKQVYRNVMPEYLKKYQDKALNIFESFQ